MQRCSIGKIPEGPATPGLRNLTWLSLHACNIRDVSELLRDPSLLPALQRLSLCSNRLRLLPNQIASFTTLRELSLRCNLLQDLPMQLTRISSLARLDLSYNPLGGLPSYVSAAPQLQGRRLGELFSFLAGLTNKGAVPSPLLRVLLFAPTPADSSRFVSEMRPTVSGSSSGIRRAKVGIPATGSTGRRAGMRLVAPAVASSGSPTEKLTPLLSRGSSVKTEVAPPSNSLLQVDTLRSCLGNVRFFCSVCLIPFSSQFF